MDFYETKMWIGYETNEGQSILIGILLLVAAVLVFFKAVKHPGKGVGINMNFKEYILGFCLLVLSIMYFFKD